MVTVNVVASADAKLPAYAHAGDAGLDLYAAEECVLQPGETKAIPTGIKMEIPDGHVGLVWDRSGLALNSKLHTFAGVIDSGYRGELKIVITNFGKEAFTVPKHSKIAQLLIQPIAHVDIKQVQELSDTSRAHGGFGSTGLH